ncbi:unnamed protein product [Periconia digitata]|uniref:Uncharacterized protein n=1 Tax=Periconia digitata TaxID=1303443 RepID=A0A9W4XK65_9PLEO|nr:unnamed protein product [Periconia digitata]
MRQSCLFLPVHLTPTHTTRASRLRFLFSPAPSFLVASYYALASSPWLRRITLVPSPTRETSERTLRQKKQTAGHSAASL